MMLATLVRAEACLLLGEFLIGLMDGGPIVRPVVLCLSLFGLSYAIEAYLADARPTFVFW